jgi:oxygen-independent coproporphyrinogen-3 oxidase
MSDATIQHVTTADNVSLTVHRLGDPAGVPVLLAPGTFTNWSFWLGTRGTGFARELVARGFETVTVDFRGHGSSQRPAPGQRWNFDDWGRFDLPAVVRMLLAEGRTPLLVGHSAGGAAVLTALAGSPGIEDNVRAAAIIATPLPWLQRWRRVGALSMRFAARHTATFPARLLGLGPEDELSGVMEQWMDWNIRGRWVGRDGTDYGVAFGRLELPLLFIAGTGDRRWAPPDACRGLFDLAGSRDRLFIEAGIDTGFSRNYSHVDIIVSREARDEIWPLLADWLGAHASRR